MSSKKPSNKTFLLCVSIYCIFSDLNTVDTTLSTSQKLELKKCGPLCTYVDLCINSNFYEESEFMIGLCNFMIQDIIHVSDEEKVLRFAPKYMQHFHNFELSKHVTREKRSSKKKVGK